MSGIRVLAVSCLLALLGACATPARVVPPSAHAEQHFVRTGKFALRVSEPYQADHAVQGGFVWQDENESLMLDLTSPLGATLARISINETGALLRESNGKETRAATAESLVQQVLGAPVPVSVLRHWVRGAPAPAAAVEDVQQDAAGRMSSFTQEGWKVDLGQYDALGPTRLTAVRQHDTQTFHLRLVMAP